MEHFGCCLRLHGPFSCTTRDGAALVLGAKHQALLALLATAEDGVRTRAYLQSMLWSLTGHEQAAASLRTALSSLRKALKDDKAILQSNRERIWLDLSKVQVIMPRPGDTFLEGLDLRGEAEFATWLRTERAAYAGSAPTSGPASAPTGTTTRIATLGFSQPEEDVRNQALLPSIVVLPFNNRAAMGPKEVLGHLVSEQISRTLSRNENFSVISHLTARNFASPLVTADTIKTQLKAQYLVSGNYVIAGKMVRFEIDLHSLNADRMIWSREFVAPLSDLLSGESDMAQAVGSITCRSVLRETVEMVAKRPLPSLESHELLMAGISMMQSPDYKTFVSAGRLLQAVSDRVPGHPVPLAWQANWHAMNVNKGYSQNIARDFQKARDLAGEALEHDPYSSFALSVRGMVMAHGTQDLPEARKLLTSALDCNPSQPLAHLHLATLNAFEDDPQAAIAHAERATFLSPMDPQQYLFQSLVATAYLSAGRYAEALSSADLSLKLNRNHPSTLRVRVIALQHLGREEEARRALTELRRIEPQLTVTRYLSRHPSAQSKTGQSWAEALRAAGLPD